MCGLTFSVLICVGMLACRQSWFSYEGTVARQEGRVALAQGGPHEGTWQDQDLIVRYRYIRDPNRLQLEGILELGARLTKGFVEVKQFSVTAVFMDAENRILKTRVLVSVGSGMIRPWSFRTTVEIPSQVTAMNFSYRGVAFDSAEEGGKVSSSFWKTP
jgi:hypothetical protein